MNARVRPLFDTSSSHSPPRLRCLWISRAIPFPQDAGDRIYSARMACALAMANVEVRYLAHQESPVKVDALPPEVNWEIVPGTPKPALRAALSLRPHIAALHDTAAFRALVWKHLQQPWDAVVLDGYASGWALPLVQAVRHGGRRPVTVYLSHNHETSLWHSMTKATPPLSLRRLKVWQNAVKVQALERRLVREVDVLTTITADDALTYAPMEKSRDRPLSKLVLTPGYAGDVRAARHISERTPRHVVMLGSFRWSIKQENLRRLVAAADPVFAAHGITLDIIGDVPDELRNELLPHCRATRFHGFVKDPQVFMDGARIALVPEVVGGGFKLKLLDYVFARVPVVVLDAALAGVPEALRDCMLSCPDLEALIETVTRYIDEVTLLNGLQQQAADAARELFRWEDRGAALAQLIDRARSAT